MLCASRPLGNRVWMPRLYTHDPSAVPVAMEEDGQMVISGGEARGWRRLRGRAMGDPYPTDSAVDKNYVTHADNRAAKIEPTPI